MWFTTASYNHTHNTNDKNNTNSNNNIQEKRSGISVGIDRYLNPGTGSELKKVNLYIELKDTAFMFKIRIFLD